jgi:hypothetical protein
MRKLMTQSIDALRVTVRERESSAQWEAHYGKGAFTKPIEVQLARVLEDLGFSRELGAKSADRFLGKEGRVQSAAGTLQKHGWPGSFRIDAMSKVGPTIIELKVAKLDVVRGKAGGRCLHDIGNWAKDVHRLQVIKRHVPDAWCWFLLIGLWRHARDRDVFEAFQTKLENETANDLRRPEPELHEKQPHRRAQLKVLRHLGSIDRRQCLVTNGARHGIIGISVAAS